MLKSNVKKFIKFWLPIGIHRTYLRYHQSWFKGSYNNWAEAASQGEGYAASNILERVYQANLTALKTHQFERDGALFEKPQYRYPVLAYLQNVVCSKLSAFQVGVELESNRNVRNVHEDCDDGEDNNPEKLRVKSIMQKKMVVLDLGGALGTSYRHFRSFCPDGEVLWVVIEQKDFVAKGNEVFCNNELKFSTDLNDFLKFNVPDVILLSSTLQYVEDPEKILMSLNESHAPYIIFDRTMFISGEHKKLTLQKVRSPYKAQYPAWLFPEGWIEKYLTNYEKKDEFPCEEGTVLSDRYTITFKGYCFQRKI